MEYIPILPSEAALSAPSAFLVPDTREAIELAVESFLARLDELDGDPDLEADDSEDSFQLSGNALAMAAGMPGCPVSDPGGGSVDDEGEGIDEREDDPSVDGPFCDAEAYRHHVRRFSTGVLRSPLQVLSIVEHRGDPARATWLRTHR